MLPSKNRLPSSITKLQGKTSGNKYFTLIYQSNNQEQHRYRMIISKKTEKRAVYRNRLRRQLHAILLSAPQQKPFTDHIIIAKKPALSLTYDQLEQQLSHLFKQASFK